MTDVILASGSKARQKLLHKAGVSFRTEVSHLDETSLKISLLSEGASPTQAAETLGELKARKVSLQNPEALVIGSDQILSINDIWFDKPVDRDHARAHLKALSGKSHFLHTSVTVVRAGQSLWHHNETCEMTMRELSEPFIEAYLDEGGETLLSSVGAYQLEGRGAQLFSKVQGDFFTILGLPLLPLLDFLRNHGVLKR